MKRKFIILMILMPVVVSLLLVHISMLVLRGPALNESESGYSLKIPGNPEILVNISMPIIPNEMPNLKVVYREDITEDKVKMVAKELFNLSGQLTRPEDCEAYRLRGNSGDLWISDFGGIGYSSGSIEFPTNLPSFDEARAIADALMEKVSAYGLAPQNQRVKIEFNKVAPGAWSIMYYENGTTLKESINELYVGYCVKFDNFQIASPVISIGENGKVVWFGDSWREVVEEGKIQVISPRQALEKLPSVGYGKSINPEKIIINEIELAYWDSKGFMEHQDYLTPVYNLEGVCIGENGDETAFSQRIPATKY